MYSQRSANISPTVCIATFGGGNSYCRTNQDNLPGMHLLKKSCHLWCDFLYLSLPDGIPAKTACRHFLKAAKVALPAFPLGTDVTLRRQGICTECRFEAFTWQKWDWSLWICTAPVNVFSWSKTKTRLYGSGLTRVIITVWLLWKILSLAAGRNQQLLDHFIAFEIMNGIPYYNSSGFFLLSFRCIFYAKGIN